MLLLQVETLRQEGCVCRSEQLGLGADWQAVLGLTSQPRPYLIRPFSAMLLGLAS